MALILLHNKCVTAENYHIIPTEEVTQEMKENINSPENIFICTHILVCSCVSRTRSTLQ